MASWAVQNTLAKNEDASPMGREELCKDRFDKALLFLPLISNNIRWQNLILHSAMHISAHLHIQSTDLSSTGCGLRVVSLDNRQVRAAL